LNVVVSTTVAFVGEAVVLLVTGDAVAFAVVLAVGDAVVFVACVVVLEVVPLLEGSNMYEPGGSLACPNNGINLKKLWIRKNDIIIFDKNAIFVLL
jgi:hypothetical protein